MYVFIDAFGWEIYQKYGFLDQLKLQARKLETVFGFSSATSPSILTGRYPDEHLHWTSFYYDPENSPFKWMGKLAFLPPVLFNRWKVRHNLSKLVKRINSITGYFQLYHIPYECLPYFDYLEKRDYFVPGGIIQTDTIFDFCVQNSIPYYCSNWRLKEEQILLDNKKAISEAKIKLAYVYLPTLDGIMHNYGPFSQATIDKLNSLEKNILSLYEYARRIYSEVSFYIISDHGMAPITGSFDLIASIYSLGYSYGRDYVAFYDSTMARFWWLNDNAKQSILGLLQSLDYGRVLGDDELKEYRIFFANRRFGESIFLMNEGLLINPSYMGLKELPGMHGYSPKCPHSPALMLSNREIPEQINSITDIRKTMEQELE